MILFSRNTTNIRWKHFYNLITAAKRIINCGCSISLYCVMCINPNFHNLPKQFTYIIHLQTMYYDVTYYDYTYMQYMRVLILARIYLRLIRQVSSPFKEMLIFLTTNTVKINTGKFSSLRIILTHCNIFRTKCRCCILM